MLFVLFTNWYIVMDRWRFIYYQIKILILQESCRLDAILTVVDCKHLLAHLNEEKPEGV